MNTASLVNEITQIVAQILLNACSDCLALLSEGRMLEFEKRVQGLTKQIYTAICETLLQEAARQIEPSLRTFAKEAGMES